MSLAFKKAFVQELHKLAFARAFAQEMEKLGFLPMLLAGGLVGLGTLGLAAATKPADLTWRGAGFTPGAIGRHFTEMAASALPTRFAIPATAALSMGGGGAKPLSFRPPAISSMALGDVAKKLPGAF